VTLDFCVRCVTSARSAIEALTHPRRECSNSGVPVRRIAARIATIMVAIVVALAVPVSQFRTVLVVKSCCCPDPTNCHCPDHKTDPTSQPSIRACHNSQQTIVAPQLPAFAAPAVALADVPEAVAAAPAQSIPAPHPAPPPIRPDAPS
jgi:hypothetical protein